MSNKSLSSVFRDALVLKYRAEISASVATLSVFFDRPVGSGDSTNYVEAMDALLGSVAAAQMKLSALDKVFPQPKEADEANMPPPAPKKK